MSEMYYNICGKIHFQNAGNRQSIYLYAFVSVLNALQIFLFFIFLPSQYTQSCNKCSQSQRDLFNLEPGLILLPNIIKTELDFI